MEKDKILLKEIAGQIKKHRKTNNLTQLELAKKINVHKNTIRNFEKGKTIPDIKDLLKIAEVFNISISTLFEDEKAIKYPLLKKILSKNRSPLAKENIEKNINIYDLFPTGSQYYLLKRKEDFVLIDTINTQIQEDALYAVAILEKMELVLRKIRSREHMVALIPNKLTNEIKLYRKSEIYIVGKVIKKIKSYSL